MLREEKQYYTFDYLAGAALLLPLTGGGGGGGGWEICLSRTSPLSSLLSAARQATRTQHNTFTHLETALRQNSECSK